MKRVYVNEEWCLGCHLCEYNCAFANSGKNDMASALSRGEDGMIRIDGTRCVGCFTCVLVCPYGALAPSEDGVMQKCELCLKNACGEPACVKGCPNRAIVYEER